jgi:hypothetical protein
MPHQLPISTASSTVVSSSDDEDEMKTKIQNQAEAVLAVEKFNAGIAAAFAGRRNICPVESRQRSEDRTQTAYWSPVENGSTRCSDEAIF